MFGLEMRVQQCCRGVTTQDWNGCLGDDRAGVRFGSDEVHGAAGDPHSCRQRLLVRMQTL